MITKWSGIGQVAGSGKLQGTVMLSNNVVRVWHKTKTVRDTATNLVKGLFSGISSAYKSLTPAQLLAWQNATVNYIRKNALAEVRNLTPGQAFQRVNNVLTSLGLINVTTPPGVAVNDSITAVAAAASVGGTSFDITVTTFGGALAIPAGSYIKVYATSQYTASKQKFSKSDFRYMKFYANPTAINPLDIYADYIAKFGALVIGQRVGYAIEWITATPAGSNLFKQNTKIYGDVIIAA